jgi:hypothetical protein
MTAPNLLVPTCKSSRNHSLTVVARKLLLSRARKKVRKNRPQAAEAGETACPTVGNTGLAVVAQALSPAAFDFFTASKQAVPYANFCKLVLDHSQTNVPVGQTIVFRGRGTLWVGCAAAVRKTRPNQKTIWD